MTKVTQFINPHVDENNSIIIPSGTNLSNIFDCGATQLCGLYVSQPLSTMTLQFNVGNLPPVTVRMSPMYDGGSPTPVLVNYVCPTIIDSFSSAYIYVAPAVFAGVRFLQVQSSGNVASDAIIYLAVRPT